MTAIVVLAAAACRPPAVPPLDPARLPFTVDSSRATAVDDGVVHRFLYAAEGPWAIHILEARTDRCWSVAALKPPGGAIGREPTSALVRRAAERGAVAGGINADFFLFTPPGVPVGLLVIDGRLIAGPIRQPALAADSSGRTRIDTFGARGHLDVGDRRLEITGWNRDAAIGLAFFDANWGTTTDTASGVIEVTIGGAPSYRVLAIDTMPAGVAIPADGAVIRTGRRAPHSLREVLSTLAPGTPVSAAVHLAPYFPREAVGGRPVLVHDGRVAARLDTVGRSGFATSRHPRTAAGTARDGSRIFFVTVDGRQAPYSDGMTLLELATLMQALGAHDAVNLDGGGSTAMIVRDPSIDGVFRVANRPSDSQGERSVGDAVALVRRCPS